MFFLRFWSRTRDPLFAAFAAAFAMLAANQLLLTLIRAPAEESSWVFLLRLAAFRVILMAIVAKNWRPR